MKAIETHAIIASITAKRDRSLSFRVETPELTPDEKVAFMDLQGMNTKMLIHPTDETPTELVRVNAEVHQKTQSQRIRAVLFLVWRQEARQESFEEYYRVETEKIIESLKLKLSN